MPELKLEDVDVAIAGDEAIVATRIDDFMDARTGRRSTYPVG